MSKKAPPRNVGNLTDDPNISNAPTEAEMIREYLTRKHDIETEMEELKSRVKDLKEEFKGKLDLKTLAKVERILKIQNSIEHRTTFEVMLDLLLDKAQDQSLKTSLKEAS